MAPLAGLSNGTMGYLLVCSDHESTQCGWICGEISHLTPNNGLRSYRCQMGCKGPCVSNAFKTGAHSCHSTYKVPPIYPP